MRARVTYSVCKPSAFMRLFGEPEGTKRLARESRPSSMRVRDADCPVGGRRERGCEGVSSVSEGRHSVSKAERYSEHCERGIGVQEEL